MATNEILRFAETNTGTNLLTQAEYASDAQRLIGHQPGIARAKLENKALRQASLMASGLAEFIADYQANNVTDSLTSQQVADYLVDAINAVVIVPDPIPAGAVIYVARNTPPTGYIKANGAAVSRATYAALFAAIGTTFGAGNGSTTFNVPDLRGNFLRAFDDGRGIDTGRVFGTEQNATGISGYTGNNGSIGVIYADGTTPVNVQFTATNITGTVATQYSLTRPRNTALLACIKF